MFRTLLGLFGYVRRRRWLCRLICFLILVPVGLFICSNIFLNSRWVKGELEKRLEGKTGVSWEIGTLNWTPDGVVHVYDAKARLGEGELSVAQIDMEPMIRDGLSGDLSFREVVVGKPRLVLDLDWLKEEVGKRVFVEEPRIARRPDPLVVANDPKVKIPGEPKGDGERVDAEKRIEPEKPVAKQPEVVKPVPQEIVVERELPRWLRVKDAEVVLRDGDEILLEVNRVDFDLPLAGEGLEGEVFLESVSVLGKELLDERKMSFRREGGDLIFDDGGSLMGVGYDFEMRVRLVGRNAYFLAKSFVAKQDVSFEEKVEGTSFGLGANGLRAEGVLKGNLMKPSSWQGYTACFADRVHFVEHHREGAADMNLKFLGELERGVFVVPEFRMWSEDLSVLGNGYVRMDGKVTGVMRIIGTSEKMGWFTGIQNGVQLFKTSRHSLVTQWENPDRYYVDFYLDGPIQSLEWKADKVSDWESFWPAIGKMKRFIREERLEDEVLESGN